ncbi:hypothetical protein R5R35_003934 [Gryllus longicercus]|uniref:Ionotropic receptor n=1 Tax=Gryllus longicercus TaxID=2509291 RepID=A0AAN9VJW9_9ORTH
MYSIIMFVAQYVLSMAIITFFNIKALQTGNSYVHLTRYWFAFKFFYNTSANQIDYNRKCSQEVAKSADQAFVMVDGDNLGKNEVMVKDIIDVLLPALAADGRVPELGAHAALLLAAPPRPALAEQRRLLRLQRLLHARGLRAAAGGAAAWQRLRSQANSPRPAALLPAGAAGARLLRQLQPSPCACAMVLALARGATRRLLARAPLRFDSALLLAQWRVGGRGSGVEVRLAEAWRAGAGRPLELRPLGAWWPGGDVRPPPAPPTRRLRSRVDLRGVTFRAVSGFFRFERIGTLSQLHFAADLFEEIWCSMEEYYNFTTIWISRNYTEFGIKLSNGSWGDVIGALMDGVSDVGIGDVSFTRLRKEVVDFLDPVYNPRIGVYVRRRGRAPLRWASFLVPFRPRLWEAAMGAAALLALALASALRAAPPAPAGRVAPRDAWLFVAAAFCQQGQPAPRAWSGRVLCVCAHLVALVLAAAHSGALISALSAGGELFLFHSLPEALDDPRTQFFVSHNAGSFDFLGITRHPDWRRVGNRLRLLEVSAPPWNDSSLFGQLCSKDHALLVEGSDYLTLLDRILPCELVELPFLHLKNEISIILTKDNVYTGILSYFVRRMRRVGVMERQVRRHWPRARPPPPDQLSQPAVRLGDLAPLFAVLAAGALLSLLLLVAERCRPPTRALNSQPRSRSRFRFR